MSRDSMITGCFGETAALSISIVTSRIAASGSSADPQVLDNKLCDAFGTREGALQFLTGIAAVTNLSLGVSSRQKYKRLDKAAHRARFRTYS